MKPINEMSLQECLNLLRKERMPIEIDGSMYHGLFDHEDRIAIADRIESLTRWIPVEERLPNEEDADENGEVLAYSPDPTITVSASSIPMSHHFTHWRRIENPEGV